MAKTKLLYLGNGPGQGEGVSIGGVQYEVGQKYPVDSDLAAALLRKGGFEVVKPKTKERSEDNGDG